jgi:hypothetical protein
VYPKGSRLILGVRRNRELKMVKHNRVRVWKPHECSTDVVADVSPGEFLRMEPADVSCSSIDVDDSEKAASNSGPVDETKFLNFDVCSKVSNSELDRINFGVTQKFDVEPGFFENLANRGVGRVLAKVKTASGERPPMDVWVEIGARPFGKQNAAYVVIDDAVGRGPQYLAVASHVRLLSL